MDIHDVLTTRRSIRAYRDGEVSDELIDYLLRAAMLAPSAGNQQPWQFIVVRERSRLDAVPLFHPYCKMITQVPVAIVVCGDPVGKKWPDFWVQDCSAAVQNILLAARGKGLGSVWTGVYPREERMASCREAFSIPEHVIPFAIIPIGWPVDGGFTEVDRFKPELIHRERFSA